VSKIGFSRKIYACFIFGGTEMPKEKKLKTPIKGKKKERSGNKVKCTCANCDIHKVIENEPGT
jgi:hypothetical protein